MVLLGVELPMLPSDVSDDEWCAYSAQLAMKAWLMPMHATSSLPVRACARLFACCCCLGPGNPRLRERCQAHATRLASLAIVVTDCGLSGVPLKCIISLVATCRTETGNAESVPVVLLH